MSSLIKVTPVVGGQEDGGVCSILEIGGCRLLLDCGATGSKVSNLYENVEGIDAILISHADIEHIGALAYVNGCKRLKGIPVVCTGTHSLTYSLTHSPTHSLTHSLTYSLTHAQSQCISSDNYYYMISV